MDFDAVSDYADSINMKLYTMHWPQMVHFYAEELIAHNDQPLNETALITAISNLFDFEDGRRGTTLDDYLYPPPNRPHRAGPQAQLRKIKQAQSETEGRANLYPVVHGYGPLDDFENRLHVAWDSGAPGIWVNRYCYLGEDKIAAIGRLGE
jgi:hypothetical protein